MRALIIGLLIIGLICVSFLGYRRVRESRELTDGAIHSSDLMTDRQQAEFDRSRAAHSRSADEQVAAPGTPNEGENGLPGTPAGAPDSSLYSGRGRFQWYRQKNLTYRLDTETGRSCVAYATLEEWQKPVVKGFACTDTR